MFTVKVKTSGPSRERVDQHWKGSTFKDLLQFISRRMGDQARVNIIKFGGPGGKWKRLSGFNAATNRKDRIPAKGTDADAAVRRVAAIRKGVRGKGPSTARDSLRYLVHLGYARRKARGSTPGAGKYGPNVVLRDTGEMAANMTGKIRVVPGAVFVTMVSDGQEPGRDISNNDLFIAHATGAGNLPVRNPAEDMAFFEAEANAAAQLFMEKAPK